MIFSVDETLIIVVIQHTIFLFKLGGIVYKIHVVSVYFVTKLYMEIIQHVIGFIYIV